MDAFDVVVVGGGIVGSSVTMQLAMQLPDARIAVIDRGPVAGGTSSCCMGHLMVTPDDAQHYAFSHRSVALWRELHQQASALGAGFDYLDTGAIYLADDGEDVPLLGQLRGQFEAQGDRAELIDPQQLRELEPGLAHDLPGGLFYPGDGVVLPMTAAGAMLRVARSRNERLEVMPGVEVQGVRQVHGRITGIRTSTGTLSTGNVVIASGVWSPVVARMCGIEDLPIVPRAGNLAITAHHCSPVRYQLLEVSYLRVAHGAAQADPDRPGEDPGAHAVNMQPQSHGGCLVGSTRQFRGMDRTVDRALLQKALVRAARYAPALADAPIVRTWAGLRPYSKDGNPWIGPWPGVDGLWFATGHEGLGITLAPITGELIAQMIGGRPCSIDPTPYLPATRQCAGSNA